MTFCVGGVIWHILIESVFNGGFDESVRWLWLPWLVLVIGYLVRYRRWLRERFGGETWKAIGTAAVMYPILVLMSWPYVMAVNAVRDVGLIEYDGRVEKKWISEGRVREHMLEIRDSGTAQATVPVGQDLYESAQVGQFAHCTYWQGAFGIPYRWRYGEAAPVCRLRPN